MRELVVTQNITVDGVIEAADWFSGADADPAATADLNAALLEQAAASDAVLFGRQTFEDMRSYWPARTGDTTGVTEHLNTVTKYVVSRTLTEPGWTNSEILRGPLTEEIAGIKARPGRDIVLTGSIRLCHALIAADLVDEYRLFVYPVVVGTGARLFADATGVPPLRLAESRAFRSGVVLLRYRRG
ncbi:dihydrofolate reductase family protein [Nocardia sp. NPDC057227]|uniref:dihydrofolate reductase family protein n=1 Tax=Nocardia sp. NPDC057227 TaxID=3346056 RepID=UPI003642E823